MNECKKIGFLGRALGVGIAVLGLGLVATAPAALAGKPGSGTTTTTPNTYAGRATVLNASVTIASLLGLPTTVPLIVSDTGELDATGGMRDAGLSELLTPPPLTVDLAVASAATVGSGNTTDSTATVVGLGADVASLVRIQAGILTANAVATCSNGSASYTAASSIVDLVINGQPIAANGMVNQTITLPGLAVITLNEQAMVAGRKTVNALHVKVGGVLAGLVTADVVISRAEAGITCGTTRNPECPVKDFVTGGGYVIGNGGAKANFGFVGGLKANGLQGHLQFNDKNSSGPKISGNSVTRYAESGLVSRTLDYGCKVNGGTGQICTLNVADNGEPGSSDTFDLSTLGYATGFQVISGGNIQLHKPNCPTVTPSTPSKGRGK